MAMAEYEATGNLSPNSFLWNSRWNTTSMTTGTQVVTSTGFYAEQTGGSYYECNQTGIKGVPHMPALGNAHHQIGSFMPLSKQTLRFRADNCAMCGQRIVNYTPRYEVPRPNGWRLVASLTPEYVIQEFPW